MKGKFEYQKICKQCGKQFIAQKTTTKYCSETCAKRGNKEERRQERLQIECVETRERNRQNLLSQEYLSITSAAALLDISRPTIYKMITNGTLPAIRLSERIIRINKRDLQQIKTAPAPINSSISEINKMKEEHISVADAQQFFKISLTHLYNKIREQQLKPVIITGKAHYSKKTLQKIFAKKQHADIAEWYTIAEIMDKFNVSKQYVYEYTSDHQMPKKREGKTVLISKYHWDQSRGIDPATNEEYYTVPQATAKFNIGRNHLYDLIRTHKISKIKKGKTILIHRSELDNLMNNRKK